MATVAVLLEELNTKEAAVSTADLAEKLRASKETTLKQLTREKSKGHVDGNSQEGWLITDSGRKALEEGSLKPSMVDEGVTPRQKFEAIAGRIGIKEDRIGLAADIVWSGDYTDLKWVWEALGQADIRDDLRKIWVNSWRAFLKKGIPPELAIELTGVAQVAGGEKVEVGTGQKVEEGRSYILVDDMPIYVGKNLGDLFYNDAVDLARIRAARAARPVAQAGSPSQPSPADEIIKVMDAVRDWTGPSQPKSYVVTQGEERAVVRELEPGQPLVLEQPRGNPPATYFVDNQGNVKQAQPGEPIVITQRPPPSAPPAKTFIVKQTPEGFVTEEFEPGKPIILNAPSPGSNIPMLPYPVIGSDGQPVYDKDGKPVYANIEPMMKWMGFQNEQRRADERHGMLMSLGQAARENLGDGIAAIKAAAEEAKKGTGAKTPAPTVYECGDCHTKFSIPDVPYETVTCPGCKRVYTKEEVLAA